MTVEEKDEALSRTKNFTSQNPYFQIVLQRTHVHHQYDMALPAEFWRENVHEKSDLDVTLYVPHEKRTWVVKRQTTTLNGSPRAAFSKRDWLEFAEENRLKVNDVCIFELTNKNEMIFKIFINRVTQCYQNNQQSEGNVKFVSESKDHTSSHDSQGAPSSLRGDKFSEVATHEQSNRSFKAVLGESVFQPRVGKNLWDVNLASNGCGLVLCGGWRRFARENHLQPGHSCVFELVTKETDTDNSALLNVTISRPINNAVVI
ncbi:B3 domain-containing protein REM9-like [Cannabis sativa]|uniref:B3 domain-containing protein REM9-like n=1 Tax=Cannabis sativa TaxID=3483 RepID=UPI0029C9DBAE|nr:B3 domain-containing protein REM9-like [Cannabis sativa]